MTVISGIYLGSFVVEDIERAMKASPGAPGDSADKAVCQLRARAAEGYLLPWSPRGSSQGPWGGHCLGRCLFWGFCQSSMYSSCCHAPMFLLLLLSYNHLEDNIPDLGLWRGPMLWDKVAFTAKTSLWLQYKTQKQKHKIQILPYWWLQVIIKFQMEFKASFFLILLLFLFMSYFPFNSEDLFSCAHLLPYHSILTFLCLWCLNLLTHNFIQKFLGFSKESRVLPKSEKKIDIP